MSDKVIWEGRSSPLLFLYELVGIVLIACLIARFLGGHLYLFAAVAIGYFILKARSMRYSLSNSEARFSASMGEKDALAVRLTDISSIVVVDRAPWSLLGLGTVILVTDPDEEEHPCMKCIPDPGALAQRIRVLAQAAGSPRIPIEVI